MGDLNDEPQSGLLSAEENRGAGPPVGVTASGTIFNPWYVLRSESCRLNSLGSSPEAPSPGPDIAGPCKVTLRALKLTLYFERDQVIFSFSGNSHEPRYLVGPVLQYLSYETYVDYCCVGLGHPREAAHYDEVDRIHFRLRRLPRLGENSAQSDGRSWSHLGVADSIELPVSSIVEYIRVLNQTLHYAIGFYLRGCANSQYFLVEFSKSVEAVEDAFQNQGDCLRSLARFGVKRKDWKDFGLLCNDKVIAPLTIGRHPPKPGAPVRDVDASHVLSSPPFLEVFESATVFCRQVIDAYTAYLVEHLP